MVLELPELVLSLSLFYLNVFLVSAVGEGHFLNSFTATLGVLYGLSWSPAELLGKL